MLLRNISISGINTNSGEETHTNIIIREKIIQLKSQRNLQNMEQLKRK